MEMSPTKPVWEGILPTWSSAGQLCSPSSPSSAGTAQLVLVELDIQALTNEKFRMVRELYLVCTCSLLDGRNSCCWERSSCFPICCVLMSMEGGMRGWFNRQKSSWYPSHQLEHNLGVVWRQSRRCAAVLTRHDDTNGLGAPRGSALRILCRLRGVAEHRGLGGLRVGFLLATTSSAKPADFRSLLLSLLLCNDLCSGGSFT